MNYTTTIGVVILLFCSLCNSETRIALSASQSVVKDWMQGEIQAFEINHSLESKYTIKIDTFMLSFLLKYSIGVQHFKNMAKGISYVLPTDNEISGESVLKYPLGWKADPFFSASLRTKITESFLVLNNELKPSVNFWDPVSSIESFGFSYCINLNISSRLGFSLKQIRANHYTQITDDPKTFDIKEKYKTETGIEWKSDCYMKLDSTSSYIGNLEFFGTIKDLTKWSFRWQNEFQINIWKFFGILIKVELSYDEKQMLMLQYKQNLRLGIVANI